jgi:hypothetical protein
MWNSVATRLDHALTAREPDPARVQGAGLKRRDVMVLVGELETQLRGDQAKRIAQAD